MWFSWCTIFASLQGKHFGRGSTIIQHPFYYDCVEIFPSRNCMKSGSCPVSIIFLRFQNHLLCFLSFSMWKLLIIGPDFRRNITRKSDSPPAARRLYSYLWLARPLDSNAHYGWSWGYTTPLESLYQGLMGQHYPCKDIYPSFGPFIKLHHVHDLRLDLQSECSCWFQWISRDYKTFGLCSWEQIIVCGRARESIHLGKSKGFFTGTFSFKKPTPATGFKPAARQWGFKCSTGNEDVHGWTNWLSCHWNWMPGTCKSPGLCSQDQWYLIQTRIHKGSLFIHFQHVHG